MRRWPSDPSLSLISVPWGTEAGQIAGPQLLRNAASHSSLLFPPASAKSLLVFQTRAAVKTHHGFLHARKDLANATALSLSCSSSFTDAITPLEPALSFPLFFYSHLIFSVVFYFCYD